MTFLTHSPGLVSRLSQSAFVRGFIDDSMLERARRISAALSQSAFVRGFIDDAGKEG